MRCRVRRSWSSLPRSSTATGVSRGRVPRTATRRRLPRWGRQPRRWRRLRHDVVVVGVEPFRHLQSRDVEPYFAILKPTRHRKVASQRITNRAIPGRYRAHRNGHIEHGIIEGEVVAGDLVQPFVFFMAVQWRRRSSEPTLSRSFDELFFAQWDSSALFSSRPAPIRGYPRHVASIGTMQLPHQLWPDAATPPPLRCRSPPWRDRSSALSRCERR